MNKRCLHILLSPVFITIYITLGIIYFLPDYFSKYKLELKEYNYVADEQSVFFPDLNNNKISEKLLGEASSINSNFALYDEKNNLINQWNFSNKIVRGPFQFWFFDTDGDGFKEVYTVTQIKDSIFLEVAKPFLKDSINQDIKKIFIDVIAKHKDEFTCGVDNLVLGNGKTKGVKEIYFTVTTGFSGYPRNAYKYNSKTNKITKSKHLTNVSFINNIADINNDGFDEILFKNSSYGNKLDTLYTKRSDYSLWLNVLDHNLKLLFNPIEFKVSFSELKVLPFKVGDNYKLLCLLNSRRKKDSKSKLIILSKSGKLLKQKELQSEICELYLNSKKNGFVLFDTTTGLIKKIDFDLNETDVTPLTSNSNLYPIDINQDGIKEWLVVAVDKSKFTIYNEDFKEGHIFNFPKVYKNIFLYGIKKIKNANQLYVQNGNYYYLFSYAKNKYYYFKYLIYLGIFLAVFALVLLILKGQKIRLDKKIAIEKKITELQLKTIKNQIDPHFIFNAINTISGLMLTNKKLEADAFICDFSDLMRLSLKKSNEIRCSLKDELEFTEKYIRLQRVRYNNQFDYQITINNNVDLKELIPKHVLYSYVENAIKHGLKGKAKGHLKINIKLENKQLILIIEDNGGGLSLANDSKNIGTGNGLKIMENIYVLYAKLYKKKISHSIKEFYDAGKKIKGVRVKVIISK